MVFNYSTSVHNNYLNHLVISLHTLLQGCDHLMIIVVKCLSMRHICNLAVVSYMESTVEYAACIYAKQNILDIKMQGQSETALQTPAIVSLMAPVCVPMLEKPSPSTHSLVY